MCFLIPYQDEIRLRVIANSDSAEDQAEKLRVRDDILKAARLPIRLSAIRAKAPGARVTRGVYAFGGYASDTILIEIGQARGRNWWGILFPEASGIPDEKVQFDSWIIRLLRRIGWI